MEFGNVDCPIVYLMIMRKVNEIRFRPQLSDVSVIVHIDDIKLIFDDIRSYRFVYDMFNRVCVVTGSWPNYASLVLKDGRIIFDFDYSFDSPAVANIKDYSFAIKSDFYRFVRMFMISSFKSQIELV